METINNIYVEKKNGFQNDALNLDKDLQEMLGIETTSRIVNLYSIKGVESDALRLVRGNVFSEPSIDDIYENDEFLIGKKHFILELLPGQYDQRAKAAEECIQLTLGNFSAEVKYKKIYLFENVSDEELQRIRDYVLNPVEMRIGILDEKFQRVPEKGNQVQVLEDFRNLKDEELDYFISSYALAMGSEDLKIVRAYFISEMRDPKITEIRILDTYWSDHCRHTTFNTIIKDVVFNENATLEKRTFDEYLEMKKVLGREAKNTTLMDLATIGTRFLKHKGLVSDLDESEEINACSMVRTVRTNEGDKEVLVMFKNETHNHPSEIEPFGGAATCLGGAIRDPLSGRAYVYQGMRITGASDPRESLSNTLKGKLPQRVITKGAAKGFSSYGNQIGLNTGFVEEIYHEGFKAKRMEAGAVIASALKENVIREVPVAGNLILLIGGRTGRDGVGGATGSSKGHTKDSINDSGAEVQKGNAVEERKLQRFFRNEEASKMILRCNDFGAGGVSVAIGELADSIDIHLEKVPKKYLGLDPTEIAISESQERMAIVVDRINSDRIITLAEEENLEATVVAEVTETGRLRMFYDEDLVCDLRRDFLNTSGAKSFESAYVNARTEKATLDESLKNSVLGKEDILKSLEELDFASQKGLLENFDSTIGRNNMLLPYGGAYQDTKTQGMVSLIPLKNLETYDASVMTYGYDPYTMETDGYRGAYEAVVESLAKVVTLGGDHKSVRLSFQEYFRKLGHEKENWGKVLSALLGALKAQVDFGVPAIGGKDSMSGSFGEIHVPDTLISFAVTTLPKENIIDNTMKGNNSILMILRTLKKDGLYVYEDFKKNADLIYMLRDEGYLLSADTLKRGVVKSLVNMALGNRIGFRVNTINQNENLKDPGSFILEVKPEAVSLLKELMNEKHVEGKFIGETNDGSKMIFGETSIEILELLTLQKRPLKNIFNEYIADGNLLEAKQSIKTYPQSQVKVDRPKVLIPVFFGTNCELDLEYAFKEAGAEVKIFIFRNGEKFIRESIAEFTHLIKETNILMLAGGFSAADEPEGSGKYIANVLRNPSIKEAIHEHLKVRDGLILGICNGFQGLVKSGLLPYGEIIEPREDMPNLTYNTIGKHMSRVARTKLASKNTPWMDYASLGDIHDVPISHGEGRFVATEEILNELSENGQIITQYTDLEGNVTMEGPYNPNGSIMAIEGICSKDGRIFGKMGHTERVKDGLYKNYSGKYYTEMFKAGVDYFKKSK
ncbi:MAG: phosphoribosylformylglycinamidine synthase [Clostridiaceae bacterium]